MWLIAEYEASALFSLKLSSATASGGKTLLVPTPFAVKMALLDAACRVRGLTAAREEWPQIRDLQVAFRPPTRALVTNLFQKVLRPRRNTANPDSPDAGPFQKTIGYREYAQWVGALGVALGLRHDEFADALADLLLNINYLGRRGGFVQLLPPVRRVDAPPHDFVVATEPQAAFTVDGTMQILDDCGPDVTFDQVSVYTRERVRAGKDRIVHHIVLPNYRLTRSSKSFSLYERVQDRT